MTADLTIDWLQKFLATPEVAGAVIPMSRHHARQLLTTMQREAKLRDGLEFIIKYNTEDKASQLVARKTLASCEYPAENEK